MLKKIVNAISLKITENFDGVDIYIDNLEQGFNEPCFFINLLNPSEKQILGSRYLRNYLFDIVYFPENKSQSQIYEVLDKLHNVLEYIKFDDGSLIRGIKRNAKEEDSTLHYFVTYGVFIYKLEDEKAKMEKLNTKTTIKQEE